MATLTKLSEKDIPGASLSGRNPSTLKTDEFLFWLKCRGELAKGLKTKAQMVKSRKIAFVLLLFSDGCQSSTRENITETKQRNYFYRVYYKENHQFNLLFFYV